MSSHRKYANFIISAKLEIVRRISNLFLFLLAFFFTLSLVNQKKVLYYFSSQRPIDPGLISGQFTEGQEQAVYQNKKISSPVQLAIEPVARDILGAATGRKRIEVDLSNQRLYAYEGDLKMYDFLISSGLWGKTPTGRFWIWGKYKYTKMSGGSQALGTYYYLPNVPYVMFFFNHNVSKSAGFSFHGTYWHDNFGRPMSHGCINMKTDEAALLFYWTDPVIGDESAISASSDNQGTEVIIYGTASDS